MKKENIIEIERTDFKDGSEPEITVDFKYSRFVFFQNELVEFLTRNYSFEKIKKIEGIFIRQEWRNDNSDHCGQHVQETGTHDTPIADFMQEFCHVAHMEENSQEREIICKFIENILNS